MMHYSTVLAIAFVGLSTTVHSIPIQITSRAIDVRDSPHTFTGCTAEQKEAIGVALRDANTLANKANDLLVSKDGWKKNKGYVDKCSECGQPQVVSTY
jgi:hypothetical protein